MKGIVKLKALLAAMVAVFAVLVLFPVSAEAAVTAPGKVTGVSVSQNLYGSDESCFYFSPVEGGADAYAFKVSDGTYDYFNYYGNPITPYQETRILYTSEMMSERFYKSIEDVVDDFVAYNRTTHALVTDSKGNNIYPDKIGAKYTIQVCAARYDSATSKWFYGPWSDPVSFVPDKKASPTGISIKYVGQTEDKVGYLDFEANVEEDFLNIQLSTASDFSHADYMTCDLSKYSGRYEYYISSSQRRMALAGRTVYARAFIENKSGDRVYSNVVSFKCPSFAVALPTKAPTGLRLAYENQSSLYFAWDNYEAVSGPNGKTEIDRVEFSGYPDFRTISTASLYLSTVNNVRYGAYINRTNLNTAPSLGNYFRVRMARTEYTLVYQNPTESYSAFKARRDTANTNKKSNQTVGSVTSYSALGLYYYVVTTVNYYYSNVLAYKNSLADVEVTGFKLKEMANGMLTFSMDKPMNLSSGDSVEVEFSRKSDFRSGTDYYGRPYTYVTSYGGDGVVTSGTFSTSIYGTYVAVPGAKLYVRARFYNSSQDPVYKDSYHLAGKWSNAVSFTVPTFGTHLYFGSTGSAIAIKASELTSSSSTCSGVVIEKKSGKKFTEIYKGPSSSYVDTKVKDGVTYTYRARTYYFDTATKKTYYGPYTVASTQLFNGDLNERLSASGKSAIKVSWDKIKGASGYEIYKSSDGCSYTKVASVSSSSTSYTVKGLDYYGYYFIKVVAYKSIGGKRTTIEDSDSFTLSFNQSVKILSSVLATNGKTTVTWSKIAGAKNYLVEKYDYMKGKYVKYKTTKKNTLTLPAVKSTSDTASFSEGPYQQYRVRAVDGKKYTSATSFKVYAKLTAPTNVKAKVMADGAVKITWKKVKGADYYKVFRTSDPPLYKSAENPKYYQSNGSLVYSYVADKKSAYGYSMDAEITGTTAYDRRVSTIKSDGYEEVVNLGPEGGTYYYYVVAYKKSKAVSISNSSIKDVSSFCTAPAKVETPNTYLEVPTLSSVKASKGKVTVKWTKTTEATGYEVLRSTKKDSDFKVVGKIKKGSTTSYTDKKAKKGKTYYYMVRAIGTNRSGISTYSVPSKYKSVKAK